MNQLKLTLHVYVQALEKIQDGLIIFLTNVHGCHLCV